MTAYASSKFDSVLLFTMSIGLLMLMAPQFGTGKFLCFNQHNQLAYIQINPLQF
jgi:hypothetical protein